MAKRSSCSQVVPILLWGVNPFPFLQAGTTLLFCTKQFNLPSLISSQEFWSFQLPPWSFANFRNLRNPKCVCVICVQCQPNHQQPGNNCFFGRCNTLAGSEGLTWFIYKKKKKSGSISSERQSQAPTAKLEAVMICCTFLRTPRINQQAINVNKNLIIPFVFAGSPRFTLLLQPNGY